MRIDGLMHNDMSEGFSFDIEFDHFKIAAYSNDVKTYVINPINSFYLESTNVTKFRGHSVSMGFYLPSKLLFGLPSREDTLILKNTDEDVYQLYASDIFPHSAKD